MLAHSSPQEWKDIMITLSDVLLTDLQLEWHEAVALLREVIDCTPASARARAVPEPHQVELLHTGHGKVHAYSEVADPVGRLQQMLEMLLGQDRFPPQFADLLLQSHESVDAFSSALAYFERPDRAAILQNLYSRVPVSSQSPDTDELIASLRTATAEASAADSQPVAPTTLLRYAPYAVALVVLAVAAVVALMMVSSGNSEPSGDRTTLGAKLSGGVAGVKAAVGSAVASLGGGAPSVATPVEAVAQEQKSMTGPRASDARSKRPSPLPNDKRPSTSNTGTAAVPGESESNHAGPDQGASGEVVARVLSTEGSGRIYNADSRDVIAPQFIRPQVPKELPSFEYGAHPPRIEVVVLRDGSVSSVKLLGAPRNVHDSMLLSAVKAWRFVPAMRDGAPVPYRMTISVGR